MAAPWGKTGQICILGVRLAIGIAGCHRAGNLELFAVVNRIGDNVIEGIPFKQESHKAADIVRNVVLLGQTGANFEPAELVYTTTTCDSNNPKYIASPIQPASTAS